ncbi:MAG: hypothetical protein ACXIUQ_11715 [Cecembia sp.]
MANTENNLDRYFREKLEKHEEKPSALAWERLDQELGRKKPTYVPFLRIAATLLLVIGLAFVFWQLDYTSEQAGEQLAEVEEVSMPEEAVEMNGSLAFKEEDIEGDNLQPLEKDNTGQIAKTAPSVEKVSARKVQEEPASASLLAEELPKRVEEKPIELPEIPIAELRLDHAITSAQNFSMEAEEEINYRVIIKSSGIKDEPKKPNLIEGIENNVNKLGTFLSKVEQGFADLQDAKNNLFASNNPAREPNE